MLKSTFQHIPGIGWKIEKNIWEKGITNWDDLLTNPGKTGLSEKTNRQLKAGVQESKSRLEDLDHEYFKKKLNSNITWRAFKDFQEQACCLDIETTGLSPVENMVTTVCIHSTSETKSYVAKQNLFELKKDLKKYKYLITFNGARFDLPFLSYNLGITFPQIHLDLMHALRSAGYYGGLKSIEKQLGLTRDTDGVTGMDAVYLWDAYRHNRPTEIAGKQVAGEKALEILVEYNREDTVNLMELADITYEKLEKHCFKEKNR